LINPLPTQNFNLRFLLADISLTINAKSKKLHRLLLSLTNSFILVAEVNFLLEEIGLFSIPTPEFCLPFG